MIIGKNPWQKDQTEADNYTEVLGPKCLGLENDENKVLLRVLLLVVKMVLAKNLKKQIKKRKVRFME